MIIDKAAWTFSDVQFVPQYSEIISRSNVDVSSDMNKFKLELPVISANMKDITGHKMAATMADHGALGILHRFGTVEEAVAEFQKAKEIRLRDSVANNTAYAYWNQIGVSVGVKDNDHERFQKLYEARARIFCIDVAHGHHVLVKNMISWIKSQVDDAIIIAGNTATPDGAKDLVAWGADIVKVGVGPGNVCQTRKETGVGLPQLSVLEEIRTACPEIYMIADGGIKNTGDIAKALKYANAVMLGSFIAGTSETPGHVYENPDGQFYKVYGGSASGERKVENGREHSFVEGVVKMVPFRGHVKYILRKIKQNLQSSFSYSGASNLKEFQVKSVLRKISSGGKQESKI